MNELVQAMFSCYPNFKDCSLQVFWDNEESKKVVYPKIMENTEQNHIELERLNKLGAWIFFSVNSMIKWKRDIASVSKINSRVCEIDWLDKDIQKKVISMSPLQPSLILESKNSFHMYWFAVDGKKENWTKVCNWLRNFFDWDPAVADDISRVLRIPWYNHNKIQWEPFPIELYEYSTSVYTEEEMLASYTDTKSVLEKKEEMNKQKYELRNDIWDDFWERVNWMNCRIILDQISWTSFVSWDQISFSRNNNGTEQIHVNWKSTACWIDKSNKIWSKAWGWPSWVNWILWYWRHDAKDIYQWIKDNYSEMIQSTHIKTKKNIWVVKHKPVQDLRDESNEFSLEHKEVNKYTWGVEAFDRKFYKPDDTEFCILVWHPWMWKTEFSYFVARQNVKNEKKVLYMSLELSREELLKRLAIRKAGVDYYNYQIKDYTEAQRDKMNTILENLKNQKWIFILGIKRNPTIKDISEKIYEYKKKWFNMFMIDNLGKIDRDWKSEIDGFDIITSELQNIKKDIKMPIILLHHASKGSRADQSTLPAWPNWFRGSQKIKDNSTRMLEIWRDTDFDGNVTIYQYKHSATGKTWEIELWFNGWEYTEAMGEYSK